MKTDLCAYLFTLLISLSGWSGFAQIQESRGYIGYSVGPSYHVGKRSYISSDDSKKQFGKTGYFINYVNFGYLFKNKEHIGITASVIYGETYVDNTNENDWWVLMGITAGPMFSYRLADRMHLDLKFEFGYAGTINYINSRASSYNMGSGFAMDYCATVRYNIYKRLCLLLEAGYTTTNQIFPDKRKVRIQELYSGLGVVFIIKYRENTFEESN
jgi:hypothetical protein